MKVEVKPPTEFGYVLSVYVDDVRVGIHDHFLLIDVMEK